MATKYGTLELIANEIGRALEPLQDELQSGDVIEFFTELGVTFPPALTLASGFTGALSTAVSTAATIPTQLLDLETAIANEDYQDILAKLGTLTSTISSLKSQIQQVSAQLGMLSGSLGMNPQDVTDFATALLKKMLDYTIVVYIEDYNPVFVNLLSWTGIVKYTPDPGVPGDPTKPPFTKREILWSNISPLLTNTGPYLAGLYDWGLTGYDGDKLLKAIHEVLFSLSLPHIYTAPQTVPTPVNASIDFLYFTLQPELGVSPPGLSLTLKDDFTGGGPFEIPFVFDNWKISFKPKSDFVKNAKLILQPGGILKASTPSPPGIIDGSISIDLVGHDPAAKMVLFGKASGSRLEADSVVVGFDSYFVWNTVTSKAEGEFGFHVEFNDASLLIQTSDADSFLKKVLPPDGLKADFNLIFGWRSDKGFYIEGSGGLELILPIHKTLLNTITVDSSKIAIEADNSNLSASIGFSGSVKLGPFTAVIDDMGIKSDLDFPPGGGNLGPVNATLEFKPPKGLGLSVDSGSVKGAGYLSFNKDEGRYIGALELRIKDEIAVKAIGILTTKLPGGQPGYSLLLLITAEFQPIQLGFGFTLNGVGGLIALNRKMNFDALRAGVRNNTLENILFPKDPVENIDSIISTLEDTFPVAEGRYSFGPMAIIGWGTPTLITAEVGLFIEVPDPVRIALIGVIKAILPDLDAPILALQINFAGTIDFEAKFITFDASLFDSRLLWLPLSGDMAFRLKWGDEPAFVMSVGGFYPGFPVPPLNLPDLRRITVNLLDGDNPRLTLSTYFAVTSNTAQFGASVDFYYSYSNNIKIKGGVGFDALFRFSPFYFTSTIHGDLGVSFKGKNIVSVSLEGTLEGPTPWHLQGSVSFKILRISYTANFDRTFGDYQNTTLPDITVLPLLEAALQDKKNWIARLPENVPQLVTVRNLPTNPGDVVVHPQGMMAVSQKIVPLNIPISRYGNQRPSDHHLFSITLSHAPGNVVYSSDVLKEYFAPSEYFDLSQDERLGRKSFEQYTSGLKVTNVLTGLESGGFFEMPQEYETTVMDSKYKPVRLVSNTQMNNAHQTAMLRGSAAAISALGSVQNGSSFTAPAKVVVEQETYVVAQTYDLSVYQNLTASSQTEALVLLNQAIASNPELAGKLNVLHSFELP